MHCTTHYASPCSINLIRLHCKGRETLHAPRFNKGISLFFQYISSKESQGGCLSAAWLRNNNFPRGDAQLSPQDALSQGGAARHAAQTDFLKAICNAAHAGKKAPYHELCLSGQITRVIWPACGVWPFDDRSTLYQAVLLRLTLSRIHTHTMDAISRRRHRKNRLLRQYYTPFCLL
jgi:hypothetical protein